VNQRNDRYPGSPSYNSSKRKKREEERRRRYEAGVSRWADLTPKGGVVVQKGALDLSKATELEELVEFLASKGQFDPDPSLALSLTGSLSQPKLADAVGQAQTAVSLAPVEQKESAQNWFMKHVLPAIKKAADVPFLVGSTPREVAEWGVETLEKPYVKKPLEWAIVPGKVLASDVLGVAQSFIPGEQEYERNLKLARRKRGISEGGWGGLKSFYQFILNPVNTWGAQLEAWEQTEMPTGVKGAMELVFDPLNYVPLGWIGAAMRKGGSAAAKAATMKGVFNPSSVVKASPPWGMSTVGAAGRRTVDDLRRLFDDPDLEVINTNLHDLEANLADASRVGDTQEVQQIEAEIAVLNEIVSIRWNGGDIRGAPLMAIEEGGQLRWQRQLDQYEKVLNEDKTASQVLAGEVDTAQPRSVEEMLSEISKRRGGGGPQTANVLRHLWENGIETTDIETVDGLITISLRKQLSETNEKFLEKLLAHGDGLYRKGQLKLEISYTKGEQPPRIKDLLEGLTSEGSALSAVMPGVGRATKADIAAAAARRADPDELLVADGELSPAEMIEAQNKNLYVGSKYPSSEQLDLIWGAPGGAARRGWNVKDIPGYEGPLTPNDPGWTEEIGKRLEQTRLWMEEAAKEVADNIPLEKRIYANYLREDTIERIGSAFSKSARQGAKRLKKGDRFSTNLGGGVGRQLGYSQQRGKSVWDTAASRVQDDTGEWVSKGDLLNEVNGAIFEILEQTGFRSGELARLHKGGEWDSLLLDAPGGASGLNAPRPYVRLWDMNPRTFEHTGGYRDRPITQRARQMILEYMADDSMINGQYTDEVMKALMYTSEGALRTDYVPTGFVGLRGRLLHKLPDGSLLDPETVLVDINGGSAAHSSFLRNFNRSLRFASNRTGYEFTASQLRHHFATRLVLEGYDLWSVADYLGHSGLENLIHYVNAAEFLKFGENIPLDMSLMTTKLDEIISLSDELMTPSRGGFRTFMLYDELGVPYGSQMEAGLRAEANGIKQSYNHAINELDVLLAGKARTLEPQLKVARSGTTKGSTTNKAGSIWDMVNNWEAKILFFFHGTSKAQEPGSLAQRTMARWADEWTADEMAGYERYAEIVEASKAVSAYLSRANILQSGRPRAIKGLAQMEGAEAFRRTKRQQETQALLHARNLWREARHALSDAQSRGMSQITSAARTSWFARGKRAVGFSVPENVIRETPPEIAAMMNEAKTRLGMIGDYFQQQTIKGTLRRQAGKIKAAAEEAFVSFGIRNLDDIMGPKHGEMGRKNLLVFQTGERQAEWVVTKVITEERKVDNWGEVVGLELHKVSRTSNRGTTFHLAQGTAETHPENFKTLTGITEFVGWQSIGQIHPGNLQLPSRGGRGWDVDKIVRVLQTEGRSPAGFDQGALLTGGLIGVRKGAVPDALKKLLGHGDQKLAQHNIFTVLKAKGLIVMQKRKGVEYWTFSDEVKAAYASKVGRLVPLDDAGNLVDDVGRSVDGGADGKGPPEAPPKGEPGSAGDDGTLPPSFSGVDSLPGDANRIPNGHLYLRPLRPLMSLRNDFQNLGFKKVVDKYIHNVGIFRNPIEATIGQNTGRTPITQVAWAHDQTTAMGRMMADDVKWLFTRAYGDLGYSEKYGRAMKLELTDRGLSQDPLVMHPFAVGLEGKMATEMIKDIWTRKVFGVPISKAMREAESRLHMPEAVTIGKMSAAEFEVRRLTTWLETPRDQLHLYYKMTKQQEKYYDYYHEAIARLQQMTIDAGYPIDQFIRGALIRNYVPHMFDPHDPVNILTDTDMYKKWGGLPSNFAPREYRHMRKGEDAGERYIQNPFMSLNMLIEDTYRFIADKQAFEILKPFGVDFSNMQRKIKVGDRLEAILRARLKDEGYELAPNMKMAAAAHYGDETVRKLEDPNTSKADLMDLESLLSRQRRMYSDELRAEAAIRSNRGLEGFVLNADDLAKLAFDPDTILTIKNYVNNMTPKDDMFTRYYGGFSSTVRTLSATFDLGTPLIHGFGVGAMTPMVAAQKAMLKETTLLGKGKAAAMSIKTWNEMPWAKATYATYRSMLPGGSDLRRRFWEDPENIQAKYEMMNNGAVFYSSEIQETVTGGATGYLKGIPVVGAGTIRFGEAFNIFVDIARIEMYKAMKPLATAEEMPELVNVLNKMTGTINTSRAGIGKHQRAVEHMAVFFAPTLRRAIAALIWKAGEGTVLTAAKAAAKVGSKVTGRQMNVTVGIERRQAMKMLTSIAAACGAIGALIKWSGNNDKVFDMTSADFMSAKIGNVRVGFGTPWYAAARMYGGIMEQLKEDPAGLRKVDLEDHAMLKWIRSSAAPATGLLLDLINGRTFIGDPLRTADGSWETINIGRYVARSGLPFYLESLVYDFQGFEKYTSIADFLGLRTSPLSDYQRMRNLQEVYLQSDRADVMLNEWRSSQRAKNLPVTVIDAPAVVMTRMSQRHEDIQELEEKMRENRLMRGETDSYRRQRYLDDLDKNKEAHDKKLRGHHAEFIGGRMTGRDFRFALALTTAERRGGSAALSETYEDVILTFQDLRDRKAEDWKLMQGEGYFGDIAYDLFRAEVTDNPAIYDEYGNFIAAEYRRAEQVFRMKSPPDVWKYIQQRRKVREDLPESVISLNAAREYLMPYWEIQYNIWGRGSWQAELIDSLYQAKTAQAKANFKMKNPQVVGLERQLDHRKILWRRANAMGDAYLVRFYDLKPVMQRS